MRTNDKRRIPVVSERVLAASDLGLDSHPLAGPFVESHQYSVLQFGVTGIGILRIDMGSEAVPALSDKPIRVYDARGASRTRRTSKAVVVLSAAVYIIERRGVVDGYIIELRYRQVGFEGPVGAAVKAFINASVASSQVIGRVVRIDPQRMIVYVLGFLAETAQGASAVVANHIISIGHIDSVYVLWVGNDLSVIHRRCIEFVAPLPGRAPIG